jgi:hypothetical protein
VLGAVYVRGAWRPLNTDSILILNFRLADVPEGGDPAFMVYHFLKAYFPEQKSQVLEYVEIAFGFDPTSTASVATQERKVYTTLVKTLKYVSTSLTDGCGLIFS